MMRRIISTLISIFLLTTALEAGTISYSLRKKMEKASPDQTFLVRAVMQEQFDTHQILVDLTKKKAKFPEMHKAVIDGLQRTAKRTQGNVLKILAEEKKNGDVTYYRGFWISNFVKFRGTAAVIKKIANLPEVYLLTEPPKYTYPKPIKIAPDPLETKRDSGAIMSQPMWDIRHIKADRLWNMGYRGHLAWAPKLATGDTNRVLLGDIDTGPDAHHPALYWKWKHYLIYGDTLFHANSDTQYWYYPGGSTYGSSGTTSDKWWPYDPGVEANHGTHTLGTMVGMEKDGTNPVGVAPEAMFIACRASDGAGDLNNISACVQYMADPNSDGNSTTDVPVAANNSYGYASSNGCVTNDETDIKNVENAGVAMIFAIGNEGAGVSSCGSPGQNQWSDYSVFSVGALQLNYDASGNEDDTTLTFSGRGPTQCSEGGDTVKPEITAPGGLIRSTYSKTIGRAGTNAYGYEMISGTSMACPHATGAYGLLYSIFGDTLKALYPGASSGSGFAWMDSIKSAMMHSADDMGPQGNDNAYGWGKLNLARAYEYLNNMIAGGVANGSVVKAEVYKDTIDDNTSLSSVNNANGNVDYGETVNLTLYLVQDYGTSYDLAGTQATLYSNDAYVSIIDGGPKTFSPHSGTLYHNWGDTLDNSGVPFQVRVSRFTPAGHPLDFYVEVTGTVVQSGASVTDTAKYRLEVSKPQLISTIDLHGAGETYYHASAAAYDEKDQYLYVFAQDGSYAPGGQYYDVSNPANPSKLGDLSGLSLGHYTMGATFDPLGYLLASEGDSIVKFSVSGASLTRVSAIPIEGTDYSGGNHGGMPIRIRGISYATAVDRATGLLGTADSLYAWYHSYDTTNYPANRYGAVPMINSSNGNTLAYWGPSGSYGYDSYIIEPDSCYAAFSFPNGRAATWDGHTFWTTFQSQQWNGIQIRSNVARRDFRPGHYLANIYEFGTPGQYVSPGDSSLPYDGAWQMPYYLWQTDWDQFKVWCYDVSQIVLPRPPHMINQYHPGLDTFSLPSATPGVTPDTIYWHPTDSTEFVDTFFVYRDSVGEVGKNGRKALTLLGKTTDTFYVDTPDHKGEYLYAVSSKNIWGEGLYNYPDDDIDVAYGGTFIAAIELSAFSLSAVANGVIVSWRGESQSGINKWLVEKKEENGRWNKIAEMQTKGSPSNYRYLDRDVKYGRLYTYRIGAVGLNGTKYYPPTSIRFYGRGTPTVFDISRIYPNPFSNAATIKYQIPEKADVSIKVYDITGRERTTLLNKAQEPGYYTIRWKPMNMPSGVYFCRMISGTFEKTMKMTFTK